MKFSIVFAILFVIVSCDLVLCKNKKGAKTPIKADELPLHERKIIQALTTFASKKNGKNYRLVKINAGFLQIVSGTKYYFDVDVENEEKNTENCSVKIWNQPWLRQSKSEVHCFVDDGVDDEEDEE